MYTVAISRHPRLSPGTPLFANVPFEIVAEMLESALQRFGGAGRQRTKRIARLEKLRLQRELFDIAGLPLAFFHRFENAFHPRQSTPARRTPAARFLSEEMFQVPHHPDGTGAIVEHDHRSRSEAAARFL